MQNLKSVNKDFDTKRDQSWKEEGSEGSYSIFLDANQFIFKMSMTL